MIAFPLGTHHFQLRAAAVVVHDGAVLLHRLAGDSFWALPGGRVEPGEDAAATVVRELQEELQQALRCERLLYVIENFFERSDGLLQHELGLYFLAHLAPGSVLLDKSRLHVGHEDHVHLQFAWVPLATLQTVDLRPAFLADALMDPQLPFRHLVQRS